MIPQHNLRIKSLRDIDAECTCGRWNMSGTTTDDMTDEHIRQRIEENFRSHAEHASRRDPRKF